MALMISKGIPISSAAVADNAQPKNSTGTVMLCVVRLGALEMLTVSHLDNGMVYLEDIHVCLHRVWGAQIVTSM